jgi:two-component system sensor histidine kinase RegB
MNEAELEASSYPADPIPVPPSPAARAEDAPLINLLWLLRLRWGAVIGQATLISIVHGMMRIDLPLRALFVIIAVEAASNAGCELWARRRPVVREWVLAILMAFDVLLLTGLLYLTGGPFNPFSFLYLVHIALAAVVLRAGLTWALVALSLVSFGLLFVDHVWLPLAVVSANAHADHMRMHLEGMWVAFGVAAGFIVYFVQRVTRALAQREAELAAARRLTERNEKFASLATLATGAAHELSTPLSTIAVVAKELEHQLEQGNSGAGAVADARLIRDQVARCRDILVQMAADAGQGTGEAITPVTVQDLVASAMERLAGPDRVRVILNEGVRDQVLHVPLRPVAQALRGVLNNALQASPVSSEIVIEAVATSEALCMRVTDRGPGMTAEVLARAGEPFFTTKAPGQGMGLGLFLTRAVVARLNGRLDLESQPGLGTTATLVLPCGSSSPMYRMAADGQEQAT